MVGILWTIIVVLFFFWLIGFLLHIGEDSSTYSW